MQFNAESVRKRKNTNESTGCTNVHKPQKNMYIEIKQIRLPWAQINYKLLQGYSWL